MRHTSDAGRRGVSRFAWLCLVLILTLAGCDAPRGQPKHLPDLHLPHVTQVPGFEEFYQRNAGGDNEHLDSFTTYQPDGPGTTGRVLVTAGLSGDKTLLDIGLDGSGAQRVSRSVVCGDHPAVTRDSRWLLCANYGELSIHDLNRSPQYPDHTLALSGSFLRLPAWAPDGKGFVAVRSFRSQCYLDIYRTAPPYVDAQLLAQMSIPQGMACGYYDLGWSPDGRWLAMTLLASDQYLEIYALDLSKLPLPAEVAGASPVDLTASTNMIEDLGSQGGDGRRLTWPNAPHTVTIAYSGEVVNVDILTHERHILLDQDVGQICGVSWTPDGTQLAFSLCSPGSIYIAGARPQLYVYTP